MASQAQWDTSGNSLLNGTYYFRQVIYEASDDSGDLGGAVSIYGNIAFNGSGAYTISNASVADSYYLSQDGIIPLACYLGLGTSSTCSTMGVSGTYSIAASGYGFMSSPVALITTSTSEPNGDLVYGLVSNGIMIGSSTETADAYNDLFIAAPVGAATPSFSGTYSVASFLPYPGGSGTAGYNADVFFQMSPSGGNLGTVNFTGYYGQSGASTVTQSTSGVKYTTSNGAASITFPNNANAPFFEGSPTTTGAYPASVYGPVYLYFSPDGSFCFGGSPYGYDMEVGVRSDSSTFNSGAIYYTAGLDLDTSTLASGYATSDSYYGSFTSNSGTIIEADRVYAVANAPAYGNTFGDTTTDTTYDQFAFATFANGSGNVFVGAGVGPYLGLRIGFQAPKLPGSSGLSVYLDPTSLQNTASYAPFTAGISPGEVITLYGTNLASNTVVASTVPYPNYLAHTQVLINGLPAPLVYVSGGQLSAVVPYETSGPVAQIEVVNNNTFSNAITAFLNVSTAGVFTQIQNPAYPVGLGYAVAVHNSDFYLVTPSNPAQPGEVIAVYVTGLGPVYPTIQDGAAGPANPLSAATNCLIPSDTSSCNISASIDGVNATLYYAGLAPDLAGIYQIDLQVPPTGLTGGDQILNLCGPDSCTYEAEITIAGGTISPLAEEKHASAFPRKVPHKKSATGIHGLPKVAIGLPGTAQPVSRLP